MASSKTTPLHAGDLVEVRSPEEILRTLDGSARLEGLPFMPEMFSACGKRFRVFRRADKTCNTITEPEGRRMERTVHLEGLRCDGSGHDGCGAACLLFWKEAWLTRVPESSQGGTPSREEAANGLQTSDPAACTHADVVSATRRPPTPGQVRYSCQATELLEASSPLAWWDVRQYIRDVRFGNVTVSELVRALTRALSNAIRRRLWLYGHPHVKKGLPGKTPAATLDLQAGDVVQIKSKEEIESTLDERRRNRGLYFDVEMVPYCGGTFTVGQKVERIIDEKTGMMLHLSSDCVILNGVTCSGHLSRHRLFCPRSIYPFWREIWLRRVK